MVGGKRDVVGGMPVFSRNLDCEGHLEEFIHHGDDISTVGNGERAVLLLLISLGRG